MSLLKNSTIVVVGVIVSNLLAYIFHFVAGRMLGPDDYGVFGALMALLLMVALPASALSFAITKYTSRFHSENEVEKIALLRKRIQNDILIFCAVVLATVVVFSQSISKFLKINSSVSVIIVGVSLVFALLLPINNGIVLGLKKYKVVSWNTIVEASSRLVLLFVFLFSGLGASGAILAYGLAYLVSFVWVFPYIKETKPVKGVGAKLDFPTIYRFIFRILVVNIILQSIINVPSLIIKHYYSNEFTGYWTAALNISRISLFITASVSLVMFPEIAGEKDHKSKKNIFYRATILVLLASSAVAFLFFFTPRFVIHVLYGAKYDGGVQILQYMGIAMIFLGWLNLWANYKLAKIK